MLDGVSWCVQQKHNTHQKNHLRLCYQQVPGHRPCKTASSLTQRFHRMNSLEMSANPKSAVQPEIFSALSCDLSAMHVENGQNLDRNEPGEHLKLHQISSRWFTGWCKPWIHTQRAYWYGQTHIFTQRVKFWESNGRMMWFCLTNNHQRCVSPMFKNDVFKFHCFLAKNPTLKELSHWIILPPIISADWGSAGIHRDLNFLTDERCTSWRRTRLRKFRHFKGSSIARKCVNKKQKYGNLTYKHL